MAIRLDEHEAIVGWSLSPACVYEPFGIHRYDGKDVWFGGFQVTPGRDSVRGPGDPDWSAADALDSAWGHVAVRLKVWGDIVKCSHFVRGSRCRLLWSADASEALAEFAMAADKEYADQALDSFPVLSVARIALRRSLMGRDTKGRKGRRMALGERLNDLLLALEPKAAGVAR